MQINTIADFQIATQLVKTKIPEKARKAASKMERRPFAEI